MDEIIMRRLRHLQRLEENHQRDFEERFGAHKPVAEMRRDALRDALSADWNARRSKKATPNQGDPLPKGWRKEHWKTLQAMASDYAGFDVANRQEAVTALELYEAELPPVPKT